mmetsp:Transcript_109226/g.348671  ORF Transcript_109226/g.348671 Transcript_109226/m.348671 type:complete len:270 (+) Transcript_109226:1363-2172(+)
MSRWPVSLAALQMGKERRRRSRRSQWPAASSTAPPRSRPRSRPRPGCCPAPRWPRRPAGEGSPSCLSPRTHRLPRRRPPQWPCATTSRCPWASGHGLSCPWPPASCPGMRPVGRGAQRSDKFSKGRVVTSTRLRLGRTICFPRVGSSRRTLCLCRSSKKGKAMVLARTRKKGTSRTRLKSAWRALLCFIPPLPWRRTTMAKPMPIATLCVLATKERRQRPRHLTYLWCSGKPIATASALQYVLACAPCTGQDVLKSARALLLLLLRCDA